MSFFRRSSTSQRTVSTVSDGGEVSTLGPVEHDGIIYLIDRVNGIAYTNEPENPREVGTFSFATGVSLSAAVTSVSRLTHTDGVVYLVDKTNGIVYSNNPDDPVEMGTWSAEGGIILGVSTYEDEGGEGATTDVRGFLNPNIELETEVRAINAKVVYNDVPASVKKAGYEAMNADWLDGQHQMLAQYPWFREKSLCDVQDAVSELHVGVPGQFLVRVVYGSEMKKIPSAFHAGKPGNYAISVFMPTDVQNGKGAVHHLLILPSWDPTGKAAGETLYRIGIKTKKTLSKRARTD